MLRWTFPATVLALLAFLATAGTARLFPDPLNGSLPYLPGLAALVALGWDDYRRRRPQPLGLLSAGLVFLVAVILRSADLALCDIMTSGTHFAWHLGAACVAGMATLGYARNTRHAPR